MMSRGPGKLLGVVGGAAVGFATGGPVGAAMGALSGVSRIAGTPSGRGSSAMLGMATGVGGMGGSLYQGNVGIADVETPEEKEEGGGLFGLTKGDWVTLGGEVVKGVGGYLSDEAERDFIADEREKSRQFQISRYTGGYDPQTDVYRKTQAGLDKKREVL